jgi:putative Mg2+ transporter-C (MgtC) family protein
MSSALHLTFHPDEVVLSLRLLIAAFVGGLVGWNRFRAGKPAGIGTHSLVALGAAIFVVVPLSMIPILGRDGVTRVIQGVVAGIGFLGAGEIFRNSGVVSRVHGLTSAAALWVTAGLGVLAVCGSGFLIVTATVLVIAILFIAPRIEHQLPLQAQDTQDPGATGSSGPTSTGVQE